MFDIKLNFFWTFKKLFVVLKCHFHKSCYKVLIKLIYNISIFIRFQYSLKLIYIAVIILFQTQHLHRKYNSTYLLTLSLNKKAYGFMYIYFIKLEDFSRVLSLYFVLKFHLLPVFQSQLTSTISYILMVPCFILNPDLSFYSHIYWVGQTVCSRFFIAVKSYSKPEQTFWATPIYSHWHLYHHVSQIPQFSLNRIHYLSPILNSFSW